MFMSNKLEITIEVNHTIKSNVAYGNYLQLLNLSFSRKQASKYNDEKLGSLIQLIISPN